FTGKAAVMWKIRHIEAFNALEAAALDNARAAALEEGRKEALAEGRQQGIAEGIKTGMTMSAAKKAILNKIVRYKNMGLTNAEVSTLAGRHPSNVLKLIALARKLGMLPASRISPRRLAVLKAGSERAMQGLRRANAVRAERAAAARAAKEAPHA
ncbi:MAG: Rha family transcriptional regulator, partial [Desulfovibrio sp.]|nr:Rha family transcriptional regulator [Desulfovibrio sp.]